MCQKIWNEIKRRVIQRGVSMLTPYDELFGLYLYINGNNS